MFIEYIIQNWALILIAVAFAVSLKITGLQDRGSVGRMYILIAGVFLLSVVVFTEFYLADIGGYITLRTVLMAVRYSATPVIIAMILFALQKKMRWFVFIPALILILYRNGSRQRTDIIPIAFLGLAFASGLILPFVFGKQFSELSQNFQKKRG